jgi:type IV pilus assembly protein PilM
MATIGALMDRLKAFDPERALGLRAASPPVAVELDQREVVLVRVRRRRRAKPLLETWRVQPLGGSVVPPSISQAGSEAVLSVEEMQSLFQRTGTRPGRLSLILPDNLAKITLLALPERPPSRRHLEEIIRFKMRRAVPFRLDDAAWSYQILPGEGTGIQILVALVRRAMLERYEGAIEVVGGRAGLIDLCTPNLFNLCRSKIDEVGAGDTALLNCARGYFSLLIARSGRLIFFRCKSHGGAEDGGADDGPKNGMLAREISSSLSYYQEKLGGRGIDRMLVRTIGPSMDDVRSRLERLGLPSIDPIDPLDALDATDGELTPEVRQRIAPAVGAALGRDV